MQTNRDSCGKKLREIRKKKGVESPQLLAELMGGKCSVSGILKRERGEIKVDLEYVTDFCDALRIVGNERVRLIELTKLFLLQFDPWQQSRSKTGLKKLQLDYWKRLLASEHMFEYEIAVFCGMLQCEEYRYEVLRAHGVDHGAAVAGAKQRAQLAGTLLESRHITSRGRIVGPRSIFLVTHENALYMPVGSTKGIIRQLEYLIGQELGRDLEHRILPRGQIIANFPLMYSFTVFDHSLILMESATGAVYSANADSALWLERGAEALIENSVGGEDAKSMLKRALTFHTTEL